MTRSDSPPVKITLNIERRPDGGLRVFSDDVPGFVLSHSNCKAVIDDIRPALEDILSEMLGRRVIAEPLPTLDEVMRKLNLDLLAELNDHPIRRDYVARPAA